MPYDRSKYPKDWVMISVRIRTRSEGQCECMGECGLHQTHPGPRRCNEKNGQPAKWAKGKIVLTVAHLNAEGGPCKCDPLCGLDSHLKAMCQRCHLRYDQKLHTRNAMATRRAPKAHKELF